MEKRLLLFLVLTFAIIFVWQKFVLPPRKAPPKDGGTAQGTWSEPAGGTQDPDRVAPPEEPRAKEPPPPADGWPKKVLAKLGVAHEVSGRKVLWTLDSWFSSPRATGWRLEASEA